MSPYARHFLEGLLFTILASALAGAADFVKANPLPGWDAGLVVVLVGVLLASSAYVRNALDRLPTSAESWRHFGEGLAAALAAVLLSGLADYLAVNPLPGYDPALSALLTGVLLSALKWLRSAPSPVAG